MNFPSKILTLLSVSCFSLGATPTQEEIERMQYTSLIEEIQEEELIQLVEDATEQTDAAKKGYDHYSSKKGYDHYSSKKGYDHFND